MPISPLWLWQQPRWPAFEYDLEAMAPVLNRARTAQGRVLGKSQALGLGNLDEALGNIWVEEARATARIEGESLDLDAVRSSVAHRLGLSSAQPRSRAVEGLIDLMHDATTRWREPLTLERLCGWQASLFPTGHSGINQIAVGVLRSSAEPMQIVSGPITRPKVHFEAPPAKRLPREVNRLLDWFEGTRGQPVDGLVRAGIAHLWFETLHPFEDGNGRVGRAVVDLALAQDAKLDLRLYSLSRRVADYRDDYYTELATATRGELDITRWLLWFTSQFEQACVTSETVVDLSLAKARFWLQHARTSLNNRQRKALNRLLDAGPTGFEGGMSTNKYAHLTSTSRATAYRDLDEMVQHGLLAQQGTGRGTRYFVSITGWSADSSKSADEARAPSQRKRPA